MVRFTLALLVLASTLSGCLASESDAPSAEPKKSASPENMSIVLVANSPPVDNPPDRIAISDCQGWQTGAYWLAPDAPPTDPPAWASNTPAGARVVLEAWSCNRVSIGPFERPMTMLLEYTDHISPPPQCRGRGGSYSLLSWALNDTEVVDYLARLAAPTYLATFSITQEKTPLADAIEWTWGPDGLTPSRMTIVDEGNQVGMSRPTFRFFWGTLNGAAAMDLEYRGDGPLFGERVAEGQLQAPMALAAFPAHVENGALFTQTSADGKIHYWSDLDCAS